jgi:hypothetical protein
MLFTTKLIIIPTGTIYFTEPIQTSISVSLKSFYSEGADAGLQQSTEAARFYSDAVEEHHEQVQDAP